LTRSGWPQFRLHLKDRIFSRTHQCEALPCESKPQADGVDPAERFGKSESTILPDLADALERDEIDGLTDDLTFQQLADLQYEIDSRGRLKIESKEGQGARGAFPDRPKR